MKKIILFFLCSLLLFCTACSSSAPEPETVVPTTVSETESVVATLPAETETQPETTTMPAVPVVELTEEEKSMLLKIGMAERGNAGCTECIALVMRTILNRVESDRFGSSVRSVLFAEDQYTPVTDGSYDSAEPNARCYEALDMVIYGWDESQGAVFYEWCKGESWHSKNLHFLFQHCDVRFYD